MNPDGGRTPERHGLTEFAGSDYQPLSRALAEVRQAIGTGRVREAGALFTGWRRRLERHFDWEERSVLPACVRCCPGDHDVAAHLASHRRLIAMAEDLERSLCPGHGESRDPDVHRLVDALAAGFDEHRVRELEGPCAGIDRAAEAREVRRLESEFDRAPRE